MAALLSPKEISERYPVSRALIYQWCDEKRLPHLRLGGRGRRGKILVKESDLVAFLESLKVAPDEDREDEDWP